MLCMRVAMSKKSFLANSLTQLIHKPMFRPVTVTYGKTIGCSFSQNDPQQSPGENESMMGKLAMAGLAARMFTLRLVDDASCAGKAGGSVGGYRFRSSTPTTKRKVITKKPKKNFSVRPQVGGYGYHIGMTIFGSWGWASFSMFGAGPNVAASIGAGYNVKAILFFMLLGAAAALLRKYFMSRAEQKKNMKIEMKITTSSRKRF